MKIDNNEAKKLKKDFPIFGNHKNLVYLDNAATSQKPFSVIKTVSDFYEKDNANPGRGIHALETKAMQDYNNARKTVSDFINAEPEEIIFTKNTTESLNLLSYVLSSIIPESRDEMLLTEMEHHSNLVPWQQLAERSGLKLKFVKLRDNFTLDINDLKSKLSEKTAVFSFTMVSNVLGTVNPVKEITEIAKEKGAFVIIDAAQAVAHMKVDVKEIGCDFLAFSGHKMMGSLGIGVLYGRGEFLEKMKPFNFGGGMIRKVTFEDTVFADTPEKFEAGTQNIAGSIGLASAIEYLKNIGLENISKWENELTKHCLLKLKEIHGIKIFNPGSEKSSSVVSFVLDGVHSHDVSELLNADGIAIRAGHQCTMPLMQVLGLSDKGGVCRASFSFYNTLEDIDALAESLKKIKEKFK